GRSYGVMQVKGVQLSGLVAWLAWVVVHIFYLIGFRNRLLVMVQWAWSYLTYRNGVGLIPDDSRAAPLPLPQPRGRHQEGYTESSRQFFLRIKQALCTSRRQRNPTSALHPGIYGGMMAKATYWSNHKEPNMPSSKDRRRLEVPTHLHERLAQIAET